MCQTYQDRPTNMFYVYFILNRSMDVGTIITNIPWKYSSKVQVFPKV